MSIIRNSVLSFIPHIVAIVVGVATSVITARYLGPAGRGVLTLALMSTGVMFLLGDFGTAGSITYFVSKGRLKSSEGLALCLYASLLFGSIVFGLGLLLWPAVSGNILDGLEHRELVAALFSVPPMIFSNLWVRLRTAVGDFVDAMRYRVAVSVGTLATTALILLAMGLDVYELLIATALMHLAIAVLLFIRTARAVGFSVRLPQGSLREIASYNARNYLGGLVNFAVLRVDAFILNAFADNAAVGQYSMAVTVTEKLWLIDSSIGQATAPEAVAREREDASEMLAASARNVLLLSGSVGLVLFALAPQIIRMLYGADFLPAATPLRILIPGVIAYAMSGILLQYYGAQLGRPGITSSIRAVNALFGIAMYLLFVPRWGMNGAAAASTLAYLALFAVAFFLFRRITKIAAKDILVPRREDLSRIVRATRGALKRLARKE